jgi:hypothetical protein
VARSTYVQSSFIGGEFAPSAQGRLDLPQYRTALALCQNAYPIEAGAVTRRPGTRFIQPTSNGAAPQLIPYNLAQNLPYVVEITINGGSAFARYITAGGHLVLDPTPPQVTAINTATPVQITLGAGQTWATNDEILIQVNPTGLAPAQETMWSSLVNRTFKVTRVDSTHFTLFDGLTGAGVVGTPFTGAIPTIFAARITKQAVGAYTTFPQIQNIRGIQAEQTLITLSPNLPPQVATIATNATGAADATFTWGALAFSQGPYLDPNYTDGPFTVTGAGPGAVTLNVTGTANINNGAGFQVGDVGRLIRLHIIPPAWAVGTTYSSTSAVVSFPGTTNNVNGNSQYVSIDSGVTNIGLEPDQNPAAWIPFPNGAFWYDATITGFTSTTQVTVTIGTAISAGYLCDTIRMGVYGGNANLWPATGTYFEGRAYFGGAFGNRFDTSVVNPYPTGASGNSIAMLPTDSFGYVYDTSAISYTLLGTGTNEMFWMQPIEAGIIIGTEAGEWLLSASQVGSGVITPTSIQVHQTTKYGSSYELPVRAGIATIFVDRYARTINEYLLDPFSQKYGARPLNVWAGHMTTAGVAELAYQSIPNPMVWANSTGTLIGCLYRRVSYFASEMPIMFGWHEHKLGSGNSIQEIVNTGDYNGIRDLLLCATSDNTYSYLEMLQDPFEDGDALSSAWFVDSGVTGINFQTTPPRFEGCYGVDDGGSNIYINGLYYMSGKTVSVFLAGLDMGDYVVQGGGWIQVPYASDIGGIGTDAYIQAQAQNQVANVDGLIPINFQGVGVGYIPGVVGFKYTTTIQRLRPDHQDDARTPNGPASTSRKRHHWYGLQVSAGVSNTAQVSGDINGTYYPVTLDNDKTGRATPQNVLFQGTFRDTVDADYNMDGQMTITVNRPVPLTITQIVGFMETEEI